jgi:NADPH:quinone reductase-like Zn-dependent oxidoreductase
METMHAAVVSSFDQPPKYREVDVPEAVSDDEMVVEVLAVGLHPRVRSGAAGRHYSSTGNLPMIPGIDGVGRRADGRQVYFLADDEIRGTMADATVVKTERAIELPDDVNIERVAAAMNPAMSAWVALRLRAPIEPGARVLVLGATGNAGAMAIQIAKRLGAGYVVGAGRDRERLDGLTGLGADAVVQLTDDAETTSRALAAAAAEVDLVIDYLWAEPARRGMMAILTERADRARRVDWVQIGAVAGPTIELASVALRSANLRLLGSGQGAVSTAAYRGELPALVAEIETGAIEVRSIRRPLADVERIWTEPERPGERTVLIP